MMRERDSLKDLPGVMVVVEPFKDEAEHAGFDEQAFQTDVELKLRMAGIRVLETKDHGLPRLYLNVTALHRDRDRRAAYSISLELIQDVLLRRQPPSNPEDSSEDALGGAVALASTWSSRLLGLGTAAHARDASKDLVDIFANDWLAVNPLNGSA